MSRSVIARKSPLHPSALGLNDLVPGRKITMVSLRTGTRSNNTIVSTPYVALEYNGRTKQFEKRLYVDMIDDLGYWDSPLDAMGIVPYSVATKQWDDETFVIDARKRHLLPAHVETFEQAMHRLHQAEKKARTSTHEWIIAPNS